MSVRAFQHLVQNGEFGSVDKQWFPVWLKRFAEHQRSDDESQLALTRDLAVGFSRELLKNGVPAWQKKQAMRALCAYRDLVLHAEVPALSDMVRKLSTLAEQERSFGGAEIPDARQERALVGVIDPAEGVVQQETRRELRVRGKALLTERAYVDWIERFLDFCGCESPTPEGNRVSQSGQGVANPGTVHDGKRLSLPSDATCLDFVPVGDNAGLLAWHPITNLNGLSCRRISFDAIA